jgi:hypothetical protein
MEQDTQSLYFAVEVTNNAEKAYIMEWLEVQGIDSSKLEDLFNFPFLVYTVDGTWMTEYEKVETTISFKEFINSLEVVASRIEFYNNQLEKELKVILDKLTKETGLYLEELSPHLHKIEQEQTVCFYYKEQLLLSTKTLKAFYDNPA